jgi:hypothetical protein
MLKVSVEPEQTDDGLLIQPGWSGSAVTETLNVRVLLDPHELLALTEMVPPVAPAVALIVGEVELPLQPEGSVQE